MCSVSSCVRQSDLSVNTSLAVCRISQGGVNVTMVTCEWDVAKNGIHTFSVVLDIKFTCTACTVSNAGMSGFIYLKIKRIRLVHVVWIVRSSNGMFVEPMKASGST